MKVFDMLNVEICRGTCATRCIFVGHSECVTCTRRQAQVGSNSDAEREEVRG